MLDEMTCSLGHVRGEVRLSERGARNEFAMHGVLSGVVCCEGEHPTPRGWIDPCTLEVILYSAFSVVSVSDLAQTVL